MGFSICECLAEIDDAAVLDKFRARMLELEDAARVRNFQIRDDSTLVWNFCTATLPSYWTATQVVDELVGVDLLYSNTRYKKLLERVLRLLADELHAKYGIGWKMLWHIVRTHGTEAVKVEVLMRAGLAFGEAREAWSAS